MKIIILDVNDIEVHVYSLPDTIKLHDQVEEWMIKNTNHRPSECSWMLSSNLSIRCH